MTKLQELYKEYCKEPIDANQRNSDIWEHLETLAAVTLPYDHITEFGTRHGISTVALMTAKPKKLCCYDLGRSEDIDVLQEIADEEGIEFVFHQKDILKSEIEETDCLFIDSFHSCNFLKKEFELHAGKVRHLILLHDTEVYGTHSENWYPGVDDIVLDGRGLKYAIDEFLQNNPSWTKVYEVPNNNGLTILEKDN